MQSNDSIHNVFTEAYKGSEDVTEEAILEGTAINALNPNELGDEVPMQAILAVNLEENPDLLGK